MYLQLGISSRKLSRRDRRPAAFEQQQDQLDRHQSQQLSHQGGKPHMSALEIDPFVMV